MNQLMRLIWLAALTAVGNLAFAQSNAEQIKALLEKGQDKAAYEAGRNVPQSLGDPTFDFYFGIAALNAGSPGEGTLALERYLNHYPENRSARFHLARGYFILGEDLRSREEFEDLLNTSEAQEGQVIQQYLDSIRVRASRYTPSGSAYVEVSIGYDSNINSGLDSGPVPGMPYLFIPGGATQEKESATFAHVAFGGNGAYPVAPGVALYGGASLHGRLHSGSGNDQFDSQQTSLQGGVHVLNGRHLYRAGLDLSNLRLNSQSYLNTSALVGEWQYQSDQFNRWGLGASLGQLNYRDILTYSDKSQSNPAYLTNTDVRDSRTWNLSATWTRNFEHAWVPVWITQINTGQDTNQNDRPDLSRKFAGIKTGLSMRPASRWLLAGDISYQSHHYQAVYAAGLPEREDGLLALDLTVRYLLNRNTTLSGQAYWSEQTSNIGLHDISRHAIWFKVRYDFN